jgi:hypothetical protein
MQGGLPRYRSAGVHVKGKKIKAIARELRVSRNTVRGEETVHRYARQEQPLPQLGAYVAALEKMLAANADKPQRERLTFMRMFEELRLSGYAGDYDTYADTPGRGNAHRNAAANLRQHRASAIGSSDTVRRTCPTLMPLMRADFICLIMQT